eukprot:TRINITY_DN43802_c0_g1_i1.p1 TRINITY_DN43802_c0_g1~~TRINITY_DN43802_c0_g1_i1.p1  ORF type:complete len:235 (+),score=27.00 TRINITY_DN43802_c0_g1_i1:84-707(+)
MAGRKGLDTKDSIENFRIAINTEFAAAREWEDKWGHFKAPKRRLRSEMRKEAEEALARSRSSPALGGSSSSSGQVAPQAPQAPEEEEPEQFINDRHRLMHKHRLVPQKRYAKPACTSHKYGWKPTIERLGVADYGMAKLDRTLMPEDVVCTQIDMFYSKNQFPNGERVLEDGSTILPTGEILGPDRKHLGWSLYPKLPMPRAPTKGR